MGQATSFDGAKMHYIDTGNPEGASLVLIHGFPLNHEMWEPQVEALRNDLRVIAYDLRGHGRSEVGDGQYMLEFFVDDLIALLDHLKVATTVLCGLSMGGYIALRAIERNPERFHALILCDTQARADTDAAKLKRAASIKLVKQEGVGAFAEKFVRSAFAPQSLLTKTKVLEKTKRIIRSNSPLGISGALLAMASRTDTTGVLHKITVPTLILVGEHDALTPAALSQEMQAEIPKSELHVLPNAGHLSNLENSEEFNNYLRGFLRKLT